MPSRFVSYLPDWNRLFVMILHWALASLELGLLELEVVSSQAKFNLTQEASSGLHNAPEFMFH